MPARTFSFPASHRRYVEASLVLIGAEVGRDVTKRSQRDPKVKPTINERFLDLGEEGRITVLVADGEELAKIGAAAEAGAKA